LSLKFAQKIKYLKGCFGTLFFCISIRANSLPVLAADSIDQKLKFAVSAEIATSTAEAVSEHLKNIGITQTFETNVSSKIDLDYRSDPPRPTSIDLTINVTTQLNDVAISDTTKYLRGRFKEIGYYDGTKLVGTPEKPTAKFQITAQQRAPILTAKLKSYLVLAITIVLPVFLFFIGLGLLWQIRHVLALRKIKRILIKDWHSKKSGQHSETNTSDLAYNGVFEKDDLKTLFHDMTFKQAVNLIGSLNESDKQSYMNGLNIKKPVQQLIYDQINKNEPPTT